MHKWLILMSLLWTVAAGQSAYRWVDENGQIHYSDRPAPGATQIELTTVQGYTAPAVTQIPSAPETATPPQPAQPYRTFNILQPTQQETLWNIGAVLDVALDLSPGLQAGHHLGVFLDGELIDLGTRVSQFQVQGVYRGLHTMQAVVLTDTGEEILRSLAVTFMVQQTSLQNPNNPNRG